METQRLQKQSWFNFLAALLGSVFGLMGTFGFFMSTTEEFISNLKKRRARIRLKEALKNNSKKLFAEFESSNESYKGKKIFPINTTITAV